MGALISAELRDQIVGEYIKTASGRARLAAALVQPLRTRRDYSSVARKAFLVEQLPDGALPIYDKDAEVTAYVVGEEGENILSIVKPKRIIIPLLEIAANPEIPLTQIKERRFDLVERSLDKGKSEIQATEDGHAFSIMEATANGAAGASSNDDFKNVDIPVVAPINPSIMADAFGQVARHDLRVARIFMNAKDYVDIMKWGRDILDYETQQYLLQTGLMATLWGAQIMVSRKVPIGKVYVCAEPEFFGRIPVRTELTVLSADNPRARTIGFSIFENLGFGVHNSRGLQRLVVSRA